MSVQPNGILPYGSDDDSIILRSSLKSALSITSPDVGSGGTVQTDAGAGPSFDADLGMLCTDATNEGYARFLNVPGYGVADNLINLENAGQLSIEIESEFVASLVAGEYTGGDGQTLNIYFMTTSVADGAGDYQRWYYAQVTDRLRIPAETSGGLHDAFVMIKPDSRFTRMTISWAGDTMDTYFDGQWIATSPRLKTADLWKYIYIGSNRDNGNNLLAYVRNIQISTRPVMFPMTPMERVSIVGDSLITQAASETLPFVYTVALGQIRAFNVLESRFRTAGRMIELYDQGANADRVADVETRKAAIVAENPTKIILQVGTEDAIATTGILTDTQFDTNYRALVNYFLANEVTDVICSTIPSIYWDSTDYSTAAEARRLAYNVKIESMIDISGVTVIDVSAELGGELGDAYMFGGQIHIPEDRTSLFPSGFGQYRMGDLWADALLPLVG